MLYLSVAYIMNGLIQSALLKMVEATKELSTDGVFAGKKQNTCLPSETELCTKVMNIGLDS